MEEIIQILIQFGGGKGGEPNNVAVRFLLPTFFWCILALIAFKEYHTSKNSKDLYVGTASLMGMTRELLIFVAEYGAWRGFVPFNFIYIYYPPLEHAITMLSCSFIGYAFLNFHLEWERFPRRYLVVSTLITILLYIVIACTWPGFLRLHPWSSFALFWGDLAFRFAAVVFMGVVLGTLVHAAGQGKQVSIALMIGFSFFFLDEFLMIFNIFSAERHAGVFSPIRHNLHIWAIPFLVGMYWNELQERMNAARLELTALNADLEARIAMRTAQLSEANSDLAAFNYSVSHDLRGPLRHIAGYIDILAEEFSDQLNDTGKEYLQRISKANRRMNELIDAMLSLSRTSSNELRIQKNDLSRMVLEIATELSVADPARKVEFRIAGEIGAYGDRRLLRQVIENLMGNAWKYSSRKEASLIEFDSSTNGNEHTFYIRDNGVGFDMNYAGKLFAPFERLHSKREFDGIGIGLATVRKIIRRHGGHIWAESCIGEGATFFFTLPILDPAQAGDNIPLYPSRQTAHITPQEVT